MELDQALKLVRALADGHDPNTGEALAGLHQRTGNCIRGRLVRLGKLTPSN